MEYPSTRKEAKDTGAAYYFTGIPCSRGHVALRKVKGVCVECMREDDLTSRTKRAEYFREYNRREEVKDAKNEWYLRNREYVIARAQTRPEEDKRRYRAAWKRNNPDAVAAHTKNRRRKHRNATPPWITNKQKHQMRDMYRVARTLTKVTGTPHVVDHIYPLRSETSCGLHVPWNLRVVTQAENLKKSNSVPDGPGYAFTPDKHN